MLKLLREEKGAAIVVVALSMTVLLGFTSFAVDVGNLYLNKTRLANLADAAALAGVQELPGNPQSAMAVAYDYAAQNGLKQDVVGVTVNSTNTVVIVNARRTVPYFFAQVFNMASTDVKAQAAASILAISGYSGVVPFGIVKQTFVYGQTYQLKAGAGSGYNGNYGALALGGTGASNYLSNIKYGYSGQLHIGDWVDTEPGNKSGPTSSGVAYRVGLDPAATFQTVEKNSPRIVIVPVIDSIEVAGRSDVLIDGFAAFFLEGVGGQGNNNYVTGKFMQMVMPGEVSADAVSYGTYGAKLIL